MPAPHHPPSLSGPAAQGLYDPSFEHDACGVAFLARLDGVAGHAIVKQAGDILNNLLHRGASGGDTCTGDGAGILTQVPDRLLRRQLPLRLPPAGRYGVGMFFLAREETANRAARQVIAEGLQREGLALLAWRDVPVDPAVLGPLARAHAPAVVQAIVDGRGLDGAALDRRLYVARQAILRAAGNVPTPGFRLYVASLSCRTLVYKGMLMGGQVHQYYRDLADPDFQSALAVVHQRYSTNTFPSWELAQPFRLLAHNGEINTLQGNIRQMQARESRLGTGLLGADAAAVRPVIEPSLSDSAALDNVLELLVRGGRELPHAMMMMIPQAWGEHYPMGPDLRGFFEFHAGLMEPWDGPAAVIFSDGERVGAMLDRNGLRPARYAVTRDGLVVLASESGVLDLPAGRIVERGGLRPGEMIVADLVDHRLRTNNEIKSLMARRRPYRRWVDEHRVAIQGLFGAMTAVAPDTTTLARRQHLFGYTREDLHTVLAPMAAQGREAIGAMGHDLPPAVCSEEPQLLYNYFKQTFAQVTNPPMDPIREALVMSLTTFIGNPPDLLDERPEQARLIKLKHPVLTRQDLEWLRGSTIPGFQARKLAIGFAADAGAPGLAAALDELGREAEKAIGAGRHLIILSDHGLDDDLVPIPALLAVSAVNRHLVQAGLRTDAALLVDSGEPREVMHVALLLGYGATAVHPWLAFESAAALAQAGTLGTTGVIRAMENTRDALNDGLRKVMSKMGIATLRSYRGAQVFEALGLSEAFISRYFSGTPSRLGGIGLEAVAEDACRRWRAAQVARGGEVPPLPRGGLYAAHRGGERHGWEPRVVALLRRAVREAREDVYREYTAAVHDRTRAPLTLRDMLAFRETSPVPLEEVEPVEAILKRFVTGAISFGSISAEAHETLAVAMNRIGGRSNSGEGGEDPARQATRPNGDRPRNAIRQVASGRFGVTTVYCAEAVELQIKMAQGAKPGEGGHLPGHKVDAVIARVRHATPGVALISPPPHHDIYSIEDIKQLIDDLRMVNPAAEISVKLASERGIGTIAAGVVKAGADRIVISGGDGGTGAAPLTSIRHAGMPWELGLAETQQTLLLNGLRDRVRLQVDGQIRTGRDVLLATLLGANECGFATAALVCLGCVMTRQCNCNACPVGIATQDPARRRRFEGRPEHLVAFLRWVAQETREGLAALGLRSMDEAVGRSDLLVRDPDAGGPRTACLDYSPLLHRPAAVADPPGRVPDDAAGARRVPPPSLDDAWLPRLQAAIDRGERAEIQAQVRNVHRSIGAKIAGCVARRRGGAGWPDETIILRLNGTAGQSLGAWAVNGMTIDLTGEANDMVGKGLSGGCIIIRPAWVAPGTAAPVLAGNALLYGATSGELYLAGAAGERFAVRNSGAHAVVEGTGDHACEYMTGGRVVILGRTGVNVAAGMSGGIAYVYDDDGLFDSRCNLAQVDLEPVLDAADADELHGLIARHARLTGSLRAHALLADWVRQLPRFLKIFPIDYRRALGAGSTDGADPPDHATTASAQ